MTITKKTRLLPQFVGTRIKIKLDDPESLTWGMRILDLAEGHEKAVIEWGDGTSTEMTESGLLTHTYAKVGEYEVRISDDIEALACSNRGTDEYSAVYAPMIREVRTSATLLEALNTTCFRNATNMHTFTCKGSSVKSIANSAFTGCTSLSGRIDLPCVLTIPETTFRDSPDITELHFSAANAAIITALPGYDTAFGAVNATVYFDL